MIIIILILINHHKVMWLSWDLNIQFLDLQSDVLPNAPVLENDCLMGVAGITEITTDHQNHHRNHH